MPERSSTWISTDLILKNTRYSEDETICIMSGESIDLIEAVANVAKEVHVYDTSYQTLARLHRYLKAQNVRLLQDVFPPKETLYDTALMIVPKGREFARAQMMTAMQALKLEGTLYIAGTNKGGAKTVIKDAETLFDGCRVLDYKKSHRLAVSVKKRTYEYPAEWGEKPYEPQLREFDTPLGRIEVVTMPGIFSWERLDEGTSLLLQNTSFQEVTSVLDMGCGNGVVGALAAKLVESVTMVDDNLIAVYCSRFTVERNQLSNVQVLASDVYSSLEGQTFDLILCNPPFHKKFDVSTNVANRIIEGAANHLTPGGRLLMVANSFLKYENVMAEHLRQSRIVTETGKFKVLEGVG